MVKRTSSGIYRVWIEPEAHAHRDQLPGKVRQRIKKQIESFASQPRPAISQTLDTEALGLPAQVEIRRARLEKWRIVYAVNDAEKWVWILAIRQRPPYNYDDLAELASKLAE
jgi:mRNA-degrading endonuclease RelE of RelBE toxin-antitoxin system